MTAGDTRQQYGQQAKEVLFFHALKVLGGVPAAEDNQTQDQDICPLHKISPFPILFAKPTVAPLCSS